MAKSKSSALPAIEKHLKKVHTMLINYQENVTTLSPLEEKGSEATQITAEPTIQSIQVVIHTLSQLKLLFLKERVRLQKELGEKGSIIAEICSKIINIKPIDETSVNDEQKKVPINRQFTLGTFIQKHNDYVALIATNPSF